MAKLVVLKLDGDLEYQGLRVTLEIGCENARPEIELMANLPKSPELISLLDFWQNKYRQIGAPYRIKPKKITYDGSINKRIEECRNSAKELRDVFSSWLNCSELNEINKRLREELNRQENIRLLIRTEDPRLQKLPWHLWDFIERYPNAEIALSSAKFERLKKLTCPPKSEVKILAILGHKEGIDIEADRQLLENLPLTKTVFLVEPEHQEINDKLWEESWDIIFFAGHSETKGETGKIYINPTDSLTIDELWYGLRKAVEGGLKLAIFNSCDGLGLARRLDDLQIPQMIVMRELIPDKVAQEFLKYFLTAFVSGKSFYLAVREARERLQGWESDFPCATWLPIIYQNPAAVAPCWKELVKAKEIKKSKGKIAFKFDNWKQLLLASVLGTGLVMGLRLLGFLQPFELQAYDMLMRSRPPEPPDPRLLIITNDYEDIKFQDRLGMKREGSLSDVALVRLLDKLIPHQPQIIALNVYRESWLNAENSALVTHLKNPRFMVTCTMGSEISKYPPVPAPPGIPKNRIGFSDLPRDPDGVIRRQIFGMSSDYDCPTDKSLSFQITNYLQVGFQSKRISKQLYQIGAKVFQKAENHTGGYHNLNDGGFEVLLNYRAANPIARTISLREILNGSIDSQLPNLVRDKIILIGTVDKSYGNYHRTPYSTENNYTEEFPGVMIQAHNISYILSSVLDGRPMIWFLPQWGDTVIVWIGSLWGCAIIIMLKSRLNQILSIVISVLSLYIICFLSLWLQGCWMPLVPATMSLIITAIIIRYYLYRNLDKSATIYHNLYRNNVS